MSSNHFFQELAKDLSLTANSLTPIISASEQKLALEAEEEFQKYLKENNPQVPV